MKSPTTRQHHNRSISTTRRTEEIFSGVYIFDPCVIIFETIVRLNPDLSWGMLDTLDLGVRRVVILVLLSQCISISTLLIYSIIGIFKIVLRLTYPSPEVVFGINDKGKLHGSPVDNKTEGLEGNRSSERYSGSSNPFKRFGIVYQNCTTKGGAN